MIAGHQQWSEKGLLWRAGLICAALKTLSPSHVILGPMIAIVMQATLLQMAVWVGGRSWAAYLLGGGLAMSWNLVQRILTALMVYGASLIELYQSLVDYLFRHTGLMFQGYWTPLLVLGGIFFAGGMVAAVVGLLVSRQVQKQALSQEYLSAKPLVKPLSFQPSRRTYLINIALIPALMIACLYLLRRWPLGLGVLLVAGLLALAVAYDRSLLRGVLQKPGFWIGLSLMALLSALLLGSSPQTSWWSYDGLAIGMHMGLRAVVVITGFRALSLELRNPRIAQWFGRHQLSNLLMATRVAFHTAPLLAENIAARELWRQPLRGLQHMAATMEQALTMARQNYLQQGIILILTGEKGMGKTTLALQIAAQLKNQGLTVAGIAAPAMMEQSLRSGYRLMDLASGASLPFCQRTEQAAAGIPFRFEEQGWAFGQEALNSPMAVNADLLILDEAGPLELKGGGWADAFRELIAQRTKPTLLVVRPRLVDAFRQAWGLNDATVVQVEEADVPLIISWVKACQGSS